MRTMTWPTGALLTAAALVMTIGLSGSAHAQPGAGGPGFGDGFPPGGPGGPGGPGSPRGPGRPGGPPGGPLGGLLAIHPELPLQALELTDAQREQVRTIMQGHRDEGRALGNRAHAAMEGLRKATEATVDEAAANQQGVALGTVIGEAAVLRAKVRGEVYAILTPEQQAEANKLQAQRNQRMERMEERRQQRWQAPPKPF